MAKKQTESDLSRVFRHGKTVAKWLIGLLIVLYMASGFYSVKPEQRGVVKRFGRVVTDDIPPGIHYHLPWPVESVLRPRTTEIRSMTVSFKETQPAPAEKTTETVQATESAPLLTGDENLVLATLLVQYTITEPKHYLYHIIDPDGLLKRIVQDASIVRAAGTSVEELLTIGRLKVQTKLREEIQERINAYNLGIRVASVQIQKIGPPSAVAAAFRDVTSAREDKHKLMQQSRGDRNRRLPRARSDANDMISKAEAYANEVVQRAKGDAHRFLAAWKEYDKSKTVTANRLYLEAMEEVLKKTRKILSDPDAERFIPPPATHFSRELSPAVRAGEEMKSELPPATGSGAPREDTP